MKQIVVLRTSRQTVGNSSMNRFIILSALVAFVAGHGFIKDPAARNSMWRYGFKNPPDYDDTGLYCGSFGTQWDKNKGACGVCGDAAHAKNQPHADGGKYANGIITRTYKKDSIIDVTIYLETTHHGWWEFRIGKFDDAKTTGDSMGVLNGDLMEFVEGGTRFHHVGRPKDYHHRLILPKGLTCKRCVIQWWWKAGNSWGCDKTGCGMGKGPQETFVNCADVAVTE